MSPDSEFPIEEGSLNGDIPSLDEEGSSAEAEEKPEEQTQWPFINVHAHVEGIPLRLVTGTFNCLSHTANLIREYSEGVRAVNKPTVNYGSG